MGVLIEGVAMMMMDEKTKINFLFIFCLFSVFGGAKTLTPEEP